MPWEDVRVLRDPRAQADLGGCDGPAAEARSGSPVGAGDLTALPDRTRLVVHWWLGVAVIVLAILVHALVPRYEWRTLDYAPRHLLRIDRWTGDLELEPF